VSAITGLQALAQGAILSPFTRARRLLDSIAPGHAKPIELTVGDPREAMPAFVTEKLAEAKTELSSYPKIRGSDELRGAIAAWTADQLMLGKRKSAIHTLNRLARQGRLPGDGFPPKGQRKFVRDLLRFLARRGY
jgi:hypothetical protein